MILFCSSLLNRYTFQYSIRTHTWSRAFFVLCSVSTCPLMLDICSSSCSLFLLMQVSTQSFSFQLLVAIHPFVSQDLKGHVSSHWQPSVVQLSQNQLYHPYCSYFFKDSTLKLEVDITNPEVSIPFMMSTVSELNATTKIILGGGPTAVTSELHCRLSWTSLFTFVFWGGSNCSNFRTSLAD